MKRLYKLILMIGLFAVAGSAGAAMKVGGNFSFFYSYGYGEWNGTSPFVASPGFGNSKTPNHINPWKVEAINEAKKYNGALRMMDWGGTNNSGMENWGDRRSPFSSSQYAPWTGPGKNTIHTGMAYEGMVDFCNRANRDLWICVPHKASDDFMRKLSQLVRFGSNGYSPYTSARSNPVFPPLKSNLKVYVEYSNEVWNSGFDQHHYAASRGYAFWGGEPANIRAFRWGGRRAAEFHKIWTSVWGTSWRVVRVLAGQNKLTWTSDRIWEGYTSISGAKADAFSTAPYFGAWLNGVALSGYDSAIWGKLDASITEVIQEAKNQKTWATGK